MHEDLLSLFFLAVFFGAWFLCSAVYALGTRKKVVFSVKEKATLTHGYTYDGRGSTYTNFMIYTKDNRCFKNVNSFWYWKWRSAELQAKIRVGKRYVATIYGWRIGMFNVYPNIVSLKPLRYDKVKKTSHKKRR